MPGLLSTLITTANSLRVFENAISTTQNNVSNASTPGYAKQTLMPRPAAFVPEQGLPGGIIAGELESSRSEYAEQAVRDEQQLYGTFQQRASDLSRVERFFDISGQTGVPGAINKLFDSFSAWGVAPNDPTLRQLVIDRANETAARFNETAAYVGNASSTVSQEIRDAVNTVNGLAASIRDLNVQMQRDFRARTDPSLDAELHAALGNLAEYVDFTALRQPDGSTMVLMGGQTPLVAGDRQYIIGTDFSGGTAKILDSGEADVTARITGGRLGALLQMKNTTIPSFVGQLDTLAAGLADSVNATLAAGIDLNGDSGAPLFTYDAASGAASTLRVTGITPAQLAAASPTQPGGNANAMDLTALADSPQIDGLTIMAYYGRLAAEVGHALDAANGDADTHQQLLLQARSIRDEISGVSLDEEAAQLIAFQRAYQANAKMIATLDQLTETVLGMIR